MASCSATPTDSVRDGSDQLMNPGPEAAPGESTQCGGEPEAAPGESTQCGGEPEAAPGESTQCGGEPEAAPGESTQCGGLVPSDDAEEAGETTPLAAASPTPAATTKDHDGGNLWRPALEPFTDARRVNGHPDLKNKSKKIRKFYKEQNKVIDAFELICGPAAPEPVPPEDGQHKAGLYAKISFFINLGLFVGKLVATIMSGSLAFLSSVVDSAVDLISGAVIWWTARAMKSRDYYKYPEGKRKMEPLSILVLSVIMAMASAMVIIKSIEQIQDYAKSTGKVPNVDIKDIVILCSTIVIKLILFLVMRRLKLPSVQMLAQDHRNDVISNTVALIMGIIGSKVWNFADPIGGLVIAIYIIGSWMVTAAEQVRLLAGRAAGPDFQKQITWLCLNHDPQIRAIDTVVVYHFGINYLVEVDIVLPEMMTVREAHDIQEGLQQRIESLREVERAFVHIDYEATHPRAMEHKLT